MEPNSFLLISQQPKAYSSPQPDESSVLSYTGKDTTNTIFPSVPRPSK